jgi:hypothetical protein
MIDEWYLDTGNTHHMTGRARVLLRPGLHRERLCQVRGRLRRGD